MGHRRPKWTAALMKKWIAEGRGRGEGSNYKPWLTIHDVPSQGRCHRIYDLINGRVHHLLSDLELHIYYIYAWSLPVADIMEQYPLLPLEETVAIAKQIGVSHPVDPKTRYPIVITSDFLLKIRLALHFEYKVRTAKYMSALDDYRVREKLEIERLYWEARNLDWGITTEESVPKQLVENIDWVYPYYHLESLRPLTQLEIDKIARHLTEKVLATEAPLRRLTSSCDQELRLRRGQSLSVIRHLLAKRYWNVDMTHRIRPSERLTLTEASESTFFSLRKQAV